MSKTLLPGITDTVTGLPVGSYELLDHTVESLENYLVRGYHPGGFVSAVLAMDMEGALYRADNWNRKRLWETGRWICEYAPHGSWGSYKAIDTWCSDQDGCRTRYVQELEKRRVAEILQGDHCE